MAPVYPFFDGGETVRAAEARATLDVGFARAASAPKALCEKVGDRAGARIPTGDSDLSRRLHHRAVRVWTNS